MTTHSIVIDLSGSIVIEVDSNLDRDEVINNIKSGKYALGISKVELTEVDYDKEEVFKSIQDDCLSESYAEYYVSDIV